MSRLDHMVISGQVKTLEALLERLRGTQQNVREEVKHLQSRIAQLEEAITQTGDIINIVNTNIDNFRKHAVTHASQRAGLPQSGTDPIDPYEFDWTDAHKWVPDDDEVPVSIHASGAGDASHTADVFRTYDREEDLAVQHTDEGNVLVNAAAERAKVNIRAGATPPSGISDLVMWFDSRTIEDDNPGLLQQPEQAGGGFEITTWRDQSSNKYIATGNKEANATWKPLYFPAETWAGNSSVGIVACPRTSQNSGAGGSNGACWFDLNDTWTSSVSENPAFTIIALAGNKKDLPAAFQDGNLGNWAPTGQNGMIVGTAKYSTESGSGLSLQSCWGHHLDYSGNVATDPSFTFKGALSTYKNATVALAGYDYGILTVLVEDPDVYGAPFNTRGMNTVRINGNDETGGNTLDGENGGTFEINKIAGAGACYLQIAVWNRHLTADEITQVESYFATVYSANATNYNLPVNSITQQEPIVEGSKDILDCQDILTNTRAVIDFEGKLGLDTDPTYRIDVTDATQAQQRWNYDSDTTLTVQVKSTGEALFATSEIKGTGASQSEVGCIIPVYRIQSNADISAYKNSFVLYDRGEGEGDVLYFVLKDTDDSWKPRPLIFFGTFPTADAT